ncbi:FAD-dependent monooxygenase [Amycolatopsis rubida]|uniref:2-polyprenyl-6-methoxyphenol hydroxylase n=1 Tax=Amycolatopsis rubida TaxID=112413 RepID=A0A1I5ZFV4_9PSEU|nr:MULTISPECIES: NAD(P)/FAD-dependent oxidoreductase [Amycolatopsis]MYW92981.1 FAD-binding monooxygenase [Amycolatopsis rubida]NEC57968.1 FAD-dependent monooxygenase [Amycolatopsis rubida]OAP25506.1 FAD-dependent urate hydroxylase [Amycolatopsis sp. M39]SFQ55354.1 2-polyprenyl-6-methoxyphenol hydroxylase [Amycolatopsis rubida]
MTKRVLVCGAGIGGLTAGLRFRQLGWEVLLFEREPEIRTAGAGLNLWPNGVRILRELGVGEQLASISTSLSRYRTFSSTGEVLDVRDITAWSARFGGVLAGVYRRDLNRMLADALGRERIHLDHALTGVEESADRVTCRFSNGRVVHGDVLIGADGIHSVVRTSLFGEREFSSDGLVRWRGLFDLADTGIDPMAEAEVWGPDGHFGYLPMGKGRAYWFAAGDGLVDDVEAFFARFGAWAGSPVPDLLRATDRPTIIRNALHDFVKPLKEWCSSRIALLGDAAHPMLPGLAQGANQALADVSALGRALESGRDVPAALAAYQEERIAAVEPVVRLSRSLFDFGSENLDSELGSGNPLFARYERYVEGVY